MAKMYIMQGLPASGKSTMAERILTKDGNAVRINKDLLRKMLHFGRWSGRNEGKTREAARALATMYLLHGSNVIIDDTNLNEGTLQGWKDLAKTLDAKIEYCRLMTDVTECLLRDAAREEKVGRHVILSMAMQNRLYQKPEKGIVICDIDGTVADTSHRAHFVQGAKKDWKSFFAAAPQDPPRLDVVDRLMDLEGMGHKVFFVSGRPDNYRAATEEWLERVFGGYQAYETLFMRRANDSRPDTIIKQEIYDTYFKDKYPVHVVIDDRPSVIRMWQENGLTVEDVGNGVEF